MVKELKKVDDLSNTDLEKLIVQVTFPLVGYSCYDVTRVLASATAAVSQMKPYDVFDDEDEGSSHVAH